MNPAILLKKIARAFEKEGVYLRDPRHFFVNLIGLCIFPFAARPLIQRMLFENDKEAYNNFLEERKKEVPKLILNAIRNS
jgi:hypothetical protein